MAFNQSWDEDSPTDSTEAKAIDNEFRKLKEAIRERLEQEHSFYEDESTHDNVGEHKKGSARIHFGNSGDRPSPNSNNPGSFYVETDTEEVYYDNGSNWIDIMSLVKSMIDSNSSALGSHESSTTGIHGVSSGEVESTEGAQSKVDTHENKDNPHSNSASLGDIYLPMTFSSPTVQLNDGDELQLARFNVPSGKTVKLLKAGVIQSDGTISTTDLELQVENGASHDFIYTTTGDYNEGTYTSPLASGATGDEVIIRINNATGSLQKCSGFVTVVVE